MPRLCLQAVILATIFIGSPVWADPAVALPPLSNTHRDTLYDPSAPLPLQAADLDDRIEAAESERSHAGIVAGLGTVVGLAGYGALTLTQSGQDNGNIVFQTGEGVVILLGGGAAVTGLAFLLATGIHIHGLKNQRQALGALELQVLPLFAENQAPGLGVTAQF